MIVRLTAIATHRILGCIAPALLIVCLFHPDIYIDVMGKDLLLDIRGFLNEWFIRSGNL